MDVDIDLDRREIIADTEMACRGEPIFVESATQIYKSLLLNKSPSLSIHTHSQFIDIYMLCLCIFKFSTQCVGAE